MTTTHYAKSSFEFNQIYTSMTNGDKAIYIFDSYLIRKHNGKEKVHRMNEIE